ncbi:hypothetical protein FOL47_009775, partial [Perkinsus chesapeaki]
VKEILKEHAEVDVDHRDIVFRFQRKGHQSDTVYVLCKSVKDSLKIQEIAVPKRRAYGEAFGCAFVWASRQAIFVPSTGDDMDIALTRKSGPESRFNVFSAGWHEDVDSEQLEGLLHSLRFYPIDIHRVPQSDGTCGFVLKFPSIKLAKCCINRLHRLKKRWRVSKNSSFYAHAQMIDIHWQDEDVYDDERLDGNNRNAENGRQKAIVYTAAGTTRDGKSAMCQLGRLKMMLHDTPGLEDDVLTENSEIWFGELLQKMRQKALEAIGRSDAVIFMVDAKEGVTPLDLKLARMVSKRVERLNELFKEKEERNERSRPPISIVLAANKSDGAQDFPTDAIADCYDLGLGDPVMISATKNEGMDDLYDRLMLDVGDRLRGAWADMDEGKVEGEGGEEDGDDDAIQAEMAGDGPSLETIEEMHEIWLKEAIEYQEYKEAIKEEKREAREKEKQKRRDRKRGLPVEESEGEEEEDFEEDEMERGPGMDDDIANEIGIDGRTMIERKALAKYLTKKPYHLKDKMTRDVVLEERRRLLRDERAINMAIVGLPNAGKSSLVNALLKEDRIITDSTPGTTTDTIVTDWAFRQHKVRLFDTAGVFKGWAYKGDKELMGPGSETQRAIRFAHVVVIVVDGSRAERSHIPNRAELRLLRMAVEMGKCVVVAINKWDLIEDRHKEKLRQLYVTNTVNKSAQVKGMPIIFISAKTGFNVMMMMTRIQALFRRWNGRVATSEINEWMRKFQEHYPPPWKDGVKFYPKYVTQVRSRPPTFVFWANTHGGFPPNYMQQMRNLMREEFGMEGTPIRMLIRSTLMPDPKKKLSKEETLKWKRMGPRQAEAVKHLKGAKGKAVKVKRMAST